MSILIIIIIIIVIIIRILNSAERLLVSDGIACVKSVSAPSCMMDAAAAEWNSTQDVVRVDAHVMWRTLAGPFTVYVSTRLYTVSQLSYSIPPR